MIFRLSRSLPRFPLDPSDPETGPILPDGALTSFGNYSIEGFDFDYENGVSEYWHPLRRSRDRCYYGTLNGEDNIVADQLNQIPAGARARIVLRPLTAGTDGMAIFAQRYVRRPRIIVARVRHYTGVRYDDGINLQVTSGPALAAIKRIGCDSTVIRS